MRSSIKSEILENITMGILLVPFIAIYYAGDYHMAALVFGLAFFAVYAAVIYGYAAEPAAGRSGRFKLRSYGSSIATSGYNLVDMCVDAGKMGRIFLVVYIIRFILRAGFVVYIVAQLLMQNDTAPFWVVVLGFALICIYGASGTYTKRTTLGNLLIWWMLVPLILLAVFSISRMDYGNIGGEFQKLVSVMFENDAADTGSPEDGNVFSTAWMIVAVMSSFELVLFSFARTKKSEKRSGMDIIRVAVWMIVSILLSYVYVLGMFGSRYVRFTTRLSLGNRMDYVLAISWLIGAFFVASSYIFYAKEMLMTFAIDEIYVKEKGEEHFKILIYGLLFAGVLFFVCCLHYDITRTYVVNWLVYGDTALSLLLPGVVVISLLQLCSDRGVG